MQKVLDLEEEREFVTEVRRQAQQEGCENAIGKKKKLYEGFIRYSIKASLSSWRMEVRRQGIAGGIKKA